MIDAPEKGSEPGGPKKQRQPAARPTNFDGTLTDVASGSVSPPTQTQDTANRARDMGPPPYGRNVDLAAEAREMASTAARISKDLRDIIPPDSVGVAMEFVRGHNERQRIMFIAAAIALVISAFGFWLVLARSTGADRTELLRSFVPVITLLIGGGGVAAATRRKKLVAIRRCPASPSANP